MQSNYVPKQVSVGVRLAVIQAITNGTLQVRCLNEKEVRPSTIEISPDGGNTWCNLFDFLDTNDWGHTLVNGEDKERKKVPPEKAHDISYGEQLALTDYVSGTPLDTTVARLFNDHKQSYAFPNDSENILRRTLKEIIFIASAFNKARLNVADKKKRSSQKSLNNPSKARMNVADKKKEAPNKSLNNPSDEKEIATRNASKTIAGVKVYRNEKIDESPFNVIIGKESPSVVSAIGAASTTRESVLTIMAYNRRANKVVILEGNDSIPLTDIITDPGLRKHIIKGEKENFMGFKPLFLKPAHMKIERAKEGQTKIPVKNITIAAKQALIKRAQRIKQKRKNRPVMRQDLQEASAKSSELLKQYTANRIGDFCKIIQKDLQTEINRLRKKYIFYKSEEEIKTISNEEETATRLFKTNPTIHPLPVEIIIKERLRALYELKNKLKPTTNIQYLLNQLKQIQKNTLSTGQWDKWLPKSDISTQKYSPNHWHTRFFAITGQNNLQTMIKKVEKEQAAKIAAKSNSHKAKQKHKFGWFSKKEKAKPKPSLIHSSKKNPRNAG